MAPLSGAVVDASVAVKWVVAEDLADRALLLHGVRHLVAPAHWLVEASNALWAKAMRREISAAEAETRAAALAGAPVVAVPVADLQSAALRLAIDLRHPVCDCLYLALAIERSLPLVTADRRLFDAVQRQRPDIRMVWLGDLGSGAIPVA